MRYSHSLLPILNALTLQALATPLPDGRAASIATNTIEGLVKALDHDGYPKECDPDFINWNPAPVNFMWNENPSNDTVVCSNSSKHLVVVSIANAALQLIINCKAFACYNNGQSPPKGVSYSWFKFSQHDADVVKCLLNLHTTQDDTCISVKGSRCDLNDYVAGGGKVDHLTHPHHPSPHASKKGRIKINQYQAAEALIQHFVNETVRDGSSQMRIYFYNPGMKKSQDKDLSLNFSGGHERC